ncbi:MAG TPA: hypothetical protein ENN68_02415 [Methanomicrobia archaeon]|nr:hypothetical protein [Methanomicrobia archaeon]
MSETGRKTTVVRTVALPAILLIFTLLLFSGVASAATLVVNQSAPPCTTGEAYYLTIQDAIDNASAGDTLIVCPGTYNENILINKSRLTIQSDAGPAQTIIKSASVNLDVVTIKDATEVTLEGFTIRDAWGGTADVAGIFMDNVSTSTIANNVVMNITDRIDAYGIAVNNSHNNSFITNLVTNISGYEGAAGIVTGASMNNSFSATSVMNVSAEGMAFGIVLAVSDNNTFDTKTEVSYIYSSGLVGVASGAFFGDGITSELTTELELDDVSLDGAMACGIFLADSNFNLFNDHTKVSYVMAECGEAAGILLLLSFFNTFNDDTDVSYILANGLCETPLTAQNFFDAETATLEEFEQALDGSIAVGIKLAIAMNNTFNDRVNVAHINGSDAACGVVLFILADYNEFYRCTISDLYSGSPETTFGVLLLLSGDNLFDGLMISAGNGPPIDLGVLLVWSWDNTFQNSDITDCMIGFLLTAIGVSPYDFAPPQCYNTIAGNMIHDNLLAILLLDEWDNEIVDNYIEDNLAGIVLLGSWNNVIERNMIRNNTGGARCGVYINSSSDENEIHGNCFFYNGPPQAIDDHCGKSNNWDGNYWEPAPGLPEDPYLIPGTAGQRDNAPLRQCPLCAVQAPVITPFGLAALVGLLSIVATYTVVRKKR